MTKSQETNPQKTAPEKIKPQENYPGPRPEQEEPDYVKDWEAEPTKVQPETKLPKDGADQQLYDQVRHILRTQPMSIDQCQLQVDQGRVHLSGVGSDMGLIKQIDYAVRALPGVLEFQCAVRVG